MIERRIEFTSIDGAVCHLVGQDFRHDEITGEWWRAGDGATATVERMSFSVRVRIQIREVGQ